MRTGAALRPLIHTSNASELARKTTDFWLWLATTMTCEYIDSSGFEFRLKIAVEDEIIDLSKLLALSWISRHEMLGLL